MLILGIDLETSGLDPQNDCVLEVGLVEWDTDARQPVRMSGYFVQPDIEITAEQWAVITPLNGITADLVAKYGFPCLTALKRIHSSMAGADAMLAFNGDEFERLFFENWCARSSHENQNAKPIPWIDTRLDCAKPRTGSLILQCAMAGFLNPFPHRAATDVLSTLKLLSEEDMGAMIERAKIPNIIVAAMGLPFDRKDEAKNRGYWWDGDVKLWKRKIKACDLEKEQAEAGFRVAEVRS